jgi:hypothetical protein
MNITELEGDGDGSAGRLIGEGFGCSVGGVEIARVGVGFGVVRDEASKGDGTVIEDWMGGGDTIGVRRGVRVGIWVGLEVPAGERLVVDVRMGDRDVTKEDDGDGMGMDVGAGTGVALNLTTPWHGKIPEQTYSQVRAVG